ncbi:GNAT family N-acetyltransferase [Oerskovia flava]|uniref:GNAT family N-acetyltransferase n=1 Tax=Oerskovia flava TaxID=2986422 RepID=UPI00224076D5|nr:GNAT family N-acetyltransferase [Oerskovia sp. JB1-3-2]
MDSARLPVVPLTSTHDLTALHRDVLSPSFPPAELVHLDDFLGGHATGRSRSVGVVSDGAVVAGAVGSWSATSGVLLLEYLAIAPGHRGGGIGSRLLTAALDEWQATLDPVLVLAEVEHPGHHDASEAHGDPSARLRFYARHGARVLPVPYFQPGNAPGAPRVPALLLMVLRSAEPEASSVPAGPVRVFLEELLVAAEGVVADDEATRALLDAVSGDRVELVEPADLDRARVPVAELDAATAHAPQTAWAGSPDPSATDPGASASTGPA